MKLTKKGIALGCCLALVLCFCAAPLFAEAETKLAQVLGPVKFAKSLTDEDANTWGCRRRGVHH